MIRTILVKEVSYELVRALNFLAIFEQSGYALFDVKYCIESWEQNVMNEWRKEHAVTLLDYLYEAKKSGCAFLFLKGLY